MGNTKIVIGSRGFVFVGVWEQHGDEVVITHCKLIRRWGTSKGLGELVNGPLKDTVLDPIGTFRTHRLVIVGSIDVNPEKWSKHLDR